MNDSSCDDDGFQMLDKGRELSLYWSEKPIIFLEKRHLTRSKETKDLENPEDRTCTDGNKVTPVSKNFDYGHNV